MELKECGKSIDINSFAEIEEMLSGQLPNDYKAFMLEHNGGRPLRRFVVSFTEHDPENDSDFENSADIFSFNKLLRLPIPKMGPAH